MRTASIFATFCTTLVAALPASAQPPDLILHHGKIVTVDERFSIAEAIAENPHMLVAHKSHRLVQAQRFDFHELRAETFLMREPGSGTRLVMEAVFKQHLFAPARIMTIGSNEAVKQTVMAGMGVSLLSLHTLELELRTGEIGLLDVIGTPVVRNWHLVNMTAKMLSPAATAFRQFLVEHTHEYLERTFAPYRKPRVTPPAASTRRRRR